MKRRKDRVEWLTRGLAPPSITIQQCCRETTKARICRGRYIPTSEIWRAGLCLPGSMDSGSIVYATTIRKPFGTLKATSRIRLRSSFQSVWPCKKSSSTWTRKRTTRIHQRSLPFVRAQVYETCKRSDKFPLISRWGGSVSM